MTALAADKLRIAGLVPESVVDGPGLRMTIFVQGCPHHCHGCHNPHTHDPSGGHWTTVSDLIAQYIENPLLDGITFSGGEPFNQPLPLARLGKMIHDRGGTVMTYTGYVLEELIGLGDRSGVGLLLAASDMLVDGPFIENLRTQEMPFRGSANQRLLKSGIDF